MFLIRYKSIAILLLFVSLISCINIPFDQLVSGKKYVFVEKRESGMCIDTLILTLLEEGHQSEEILYGLYERKTYYRGVLVYKGIDTFMYGRKSGKIVFWQFAKGCVCKSDSEYILDQIEFMSHPAAITILPLSYRFFDFPVRRINGLYGGCHGENSFFRLVGVYDVYKTKTISR